MFYYLYQITNLVNNKIYIGVHKTENLNDDYMGSGKVIKDAIKKYGIDNFKKDILEHFDNSDAMYEREKEIVTDEFLLREDVYNLRRGGFGGFDYLNSKKTFEDRSKMGKRCHELHPDLAMKNLSKGWTKEAHIKGASAMKAKYGDDYYQRIAGISKPKSEDHKKQISESLKGFKQKQVECPHCGRVGGENAMNRHHFNNCKSITR
jgi:group I intron endonuclease